MNQQKLLGTERDTLIEMHADLTAVPHVSLSEKPKGPGKTPQETYNSFKLRPFKAHSPRHKQTRELPMQTDAMAPILVLVTSRAHDEISQVKLQVRHQASLMIS